MFWKIEKKNWRVTTEYAFLKLENNFLFLFNLSRYLCPEPYPEENLEFLRSHNIRLFQFGIEGKTVFFPTLSSPLLRQFTELFICWSMLFCTYWIWVVCSIEEFCKIIKISWDFLLLIGKVFKFRVGLPTYWNLVKKIFV